MLQENHDKFLVVALSTTVTEFVMLARLCLRAERQLSSELSSDTAAFADPEISVEWKGQSILVVDGGKFHDIVLLELLLNSPKQEASS